MYECPNCAGNLKFSIALQMLYCENCETMLEPYSFHKEQDAEEYEMNVFTCSQCGGEILSDDVTAATFCSFCDSATILNSRIQKENCPKFIIPFTKTKEDCKVAYARKMRRALFAPKELKESENIKKFRGIYMPYWIYDFSKEGPVSYTGTYTYRFGNYEYTKYYDVSCNINERYSGLAFDAAASFSDNLSGAVSLFDFSKKKKFTPAFLSGFYADIADVEKYVYKNDAEEIVVEDGYRRIKKKHISLRYKKDDSSIRSAVRPSTYHADFALLPMWFLAYRKEDRVCYAVVNGQTGKVVADIPVDPKKYLLWSLLLAVPLFFLLNAFFTITPAKILFLAIGLAILSTVIANKQLNHIFTREPYEVPERASREKGAVGQFFEKVRKTIINRTSLGISIVALIVLQLLQGLIGSGMVLLFLYLLCIGVLFANLCKPTRSQRESRNRFFANLKRKLPILAKPIAGMVASVMIVLINPVEDLFYYLGAFLCMGTVFWGFTDIIKLHNVLATRKLPQFNKRGGDENV